MIPTLAAITSNRNTYDLFMILAAVLFFLGLVVHLLRPPLAAVGLALECTGLAVFVIGMLFI